MPHPNNWTPPACATLFFVGLGACALSGSACGGSTAAKAPPLPDVAFEAWVKPALISVHGCSWKEPRAGEEPAVECSLTLLRDSEVHALTWVAHAQDGREIGQGGAGGLTWTRAGEEHHVRFDFKRTAEGPVATIAVEPL